jgi:ABC-type dipeptide/oligopeptide/nickel transport system permease component
MLAYVLRRLLQALVVMATVGFVAFMLFQYVGDPVAIMLGQDYTEAQRDALVRDLGLDQPFFVQFGTFAGQCRAGVSSASAYRLSRPVADLIMERAPATLELSLTAAVLALLVGVPMGVYTGALPQFLAEPLLPDLLADRRVAAHLPHRHPAHPHLQRLAGLAAELRPRRDRGEPRLVEHGAS